MIDALAYRLGQLRMLAFKSDLLADRAGLLLRKPCRILELPDVVLDHILSQLLAWLLAPASATCKAFRLAASTMPMLLRRSFVPARM